MNLLDKTFLNSENSDFIQSLHESFLDNPSHLPQSWQDFFASLTTDENSNSIISNGDSNTPSVSELSTNHIKKQVAVLQLINAFRFRGHRVAAVDPLNQFETPDIAELQPQFHGLVDEDMDTVYFTGSLFGPTQAKLRDIWEMLKVTYCSSIGSEYMHINDTTQKRWIQQRLESVKAKPDFSQEKKRHIYERLNAATLLEEYLHNKYVGQKRFSLEGGETLIPMLDELIQYGGESGLKEAVIGMAHRGRLNVLINTVGKLPAVLFDEFEGKGVHALGSGDVKYHLGYSSDQMTAGGPVHVTLAFNPSHLEIIDPVVEGSVRARQERRKDLTRNSVLPILIHGDAAFAGQGVVMETLNLSQTKGYSTGGTIHIIINNQIGFTTSDPLESRSTMYCSDIAKMVQAPIFHVNGDDVEAAIFITRLALEYRFEFHRDIVIDLVCYRKHGHSEADEPFATQPLMYQRIRKHPTVRSIYADKLVTEQCLNHDDIDRIKQKYITTLENNQSVAGPIVHELKNEYRIDFTSYQGKHWREPCDTTITLEKFQALTPALIRFPEGLSLHRSVERIIEQREQMAKGTLAMDWGFAENLAYASLLDAGHAVRLSGQDSGRGTFFHRHAILHDQNSGETFTSLQHLHDKQGQFTVINSILSEEAVLAFEYGFSSAEPETLVIWEAQFGDFANNAQVVIDQFISSCEAKWARYCGLVMFLPHGYDGQGPEHSSARLERYLQLCAEENIQVCIPSTPAQMFHLLRRQIIRPYRKPLVVITPKSLLRHKLSTSTLQDLTEASFKLVIDEIDPIDCNQVERIVICSGKIYFDLLEARRSNKINTIVIVRIEQLYPFPIEEVDAVLARYPKAIDVVWVQEEPRNQGAWVYLMARLHLFGRLHEPQQLRLVARPYSASPAVGYMSKHLEQQQNLVNEALQLNAHTVQQQKSA